MAKRIIFDPEKCMGCKMCELACSFHKMKVFQPAAGRIGPSQLAKEANIAPVGCWHCDEAVCLQTCPAGAIYRDKESGAVLCDENRCIGCKTCVAMCPLGNTRVASWDLKMMKCDLCQGAPACVKACLPGGIVFEEPAEAMRTRRRSIMRQCLGLES